MLRNVATLIVFKSLQRRVYSIFIVLFFNTSTRRKFRGFRLGGNLFVVFWFLLLTVKLFVLVIINLLSLAQVFEPSSYASL